MSSPPGIYHDIGRKARELLHRHFFQQPPIQFHYQSFDTSVDLACQIKDIVPGLGTVFRVFLPYQSSSKLELQYLHAYAGITAGVSLTANPLLNFSGVVGSNLFAVGTELSFDTATSTFAKYNAALSFNSPILIASLSLSDQCDTLRASCYRSLNPLTNTAIAAELTYKFLSNETLLTLGTQHALLPITMLKARVNTSGKVGALLHQQLLPSLFLTVAGEVDFMDAHRNSRFGCSFSLRP